METPIQVLCRLDREARTTPAQYATAAVEGYRVSAMVAFKPDAETLGNTRWLCDGRPIRYDELRTKLGIGSPGPRELARAAAKGKGPRLSNRARQQLLDAVRCIDPSNPKFSGSDEIRAALSRPDVRIFLTSWCIPNIEAVAGVPFEDRCPSFTALVVPR